jgi:hypothetical protein
MGEVEPPLVLDEAGDVGDLRVPRRRVRDVRLSGANGRRGDAAAEQGQDGDEQ